MKRDKFQIRFLRIAEEDLLEIITYIALDNTTAAEKFAEKIENKVSKLGSNPLIGKRPREIEFKNLNYFYLIIDNYLVFYTIEDKTIFIHRILHSARDYKSIL
ncbi:MAG: type II toxin-antitoxin system RelE/ParE family toxin [Melioribacteraceae bacterium]|nr:type II toxin-antitoxin system RelE/ParE family toxin [Melioribacteraceae bacterium]